MPKVKILYKFATRSRKQKYLKCIENIFEKAVMMDESYILVTVDYDDPEMQSTAQVVTALKERGSVMYGASTSKIDAINRDMELVRFDWDILIVMSDDFEFIDTAFDSVIYNHMRFFFPDFDGVLHYPDGTGNGKNIMTMSIIGRKYYERFKYIYHPDYYSVYCDNEATEVARRLGKYKFIDIQLFKHKHWLFLADIPDELNKRNDNAFVYAKDKAVYDTRLLKNFDL